MARQADVRRIALALPQTVEGEDRFAFSIVAGAKSRGFAWVWLERKEPKGPRLPNNKVLAIRVANEMEKQALLGSDKKKFFTEQHYNGFPAVLVRLAEVSVAELRELLVQAWRCMAPLKLRKAFDAER